jgi:peroxiredoxin
MSCNSGNSTRTIKGKYDKKLNLQKPISYIIDKKGNVKPIYSHSKSTK